MDKTEFDKLVLDNLRTVKIIASKIHARMPAGIELEDLVHTGILGLIDAVGKYDPGKGTQFTTYASLRIRGAILDELRNMDWATRSHRHRIKDVEAAYQALETELGHPPKPEEVAEKMNMPLDEFQRILDDSKGVGIGVFRFVADEEGNIANEKMVQYVIDEDQNSPVLLLEKEEMKRMIAGFLKDLPEREQLVLSLYYLEELNLKEIGKIVDVSESRVSQIRTSAILRLRGKLRQVAEKNKVLPEEIL